jgi:excinuclease ABC subunit B
MQRAIDETQRRRKIQAEYNKKHKITPRTIEKPIRYAIKTKVGDEPLIKWAADLDDTEDMIPISEIPQYISELELKMLEAAKQLQFEQAAEYRDKIAELKSLLQE